MTERVEWIPDEVWSDIVEHVPIPSVDLLVVADDGLLLAKRQNEPAKGEWFVPGGRIQKGESLEAAVHRVAREELGVDIVIEEELGAYDHHYETADVPDVGGKHYVAHGYVVRPDSDIISLDEQHSDARYFDLDTLPSVHPYVEAYLDGATFRYNQL
ncbi:NUDIX domain-containing protein [Halorubrum sp. GN11_10-6_MGM]|uniref:GDP-mannose mannosyl hydrolase n=1 Tax=Halorubrum sp. GN11_10-6_MGM TaxID=2518112 RepID=UPI0010F4E9F7|nr:NUDIX domain-containing protein [Halorubrum sp. GN11_10-6_MGM]TKX73484.1 NUDIX domain-containing protein [Halorubrum sp. GN11_10-6_MGM]